MSNIKEIINNYSPEDYLVYLKNKFALSQGIGEIPLTIYDKIVNKISTSVSEDPVLTEYSYISLIDTSAGDVTINLDPAAFYQVGRPYTIVKKTAVNNLIVVPNGSETINGLPSYTLVNQNDTLNIFTDGFNWFEYVYGSITEDKSYVHHQNISSTTWNITHFLGKRPSVTVVDSSDRVVYGNINYIDDDSLTLSFSSAFSGKAYLN